MIQALFLSIGQLGDRRILAVLVQSMLVTVAIFAVLGVGLWFGLDALASRWLPQSTGLAVAGALLVALLAAWLLFRVVAVAVIGLFADRVVEAVEAAHYPDRFAAARPIGFARSLAMGSGSAARVVLVNLIAAPLYLILLVTGVGTPVAFFVVNSWLLGRDLGDMVAARHMPHAALHDWRAHHRWSQLATGAVGTALFLVPIVNLLAPVLGAAMATHLFHRRAVK